MSEVARVHFLERVERGTRLWELRSPCELTTRHGVHTNVVRYLLQSGVLSAAVPNSHIGPLLFSAFNIDHFFTIFLPHCVSIHLSRSRHH